mgnify:CR=1 FL=1
MVIKFILPKGYLSFLTSSGTKMVVISTYIVHESTQPKCPILNKVNLHSFLFLGTQKLYKQSR